MRPLYVVTGSRTYPWLRQVFDWGLALPPDAELMQGTARGVDETAEQGFLCSHPPSQVRYRPADWNNWGKGAGHKRNAEMADEAVQHRLQGGRVTVCAFHANGSKGTASMIEYCLQRKLVVNIWVPSLQGWEVLKP